MNYKKSKYNKKENHHKRINKIKEKEIVKNKLV